MGYYLNKKDFNELINKEIIEINKNKESVFFKTSDNKYYIIEHWQDCCEDVYLEDITGNIEDLIGKLIMSEKVSNNENPKNEDDERYGTFTWTFIKFATIKGYVTLRFYGTSNGYYGEDVDLFEMNEDEYNEIKNKLEE